MKPAPTYIAHPALRIGLVAGGALVGLLVIVAVLRPEMMGMSMIRNLIVGFGL